MSDPVQIDWDLYEHLCNLPGASDSIDMKRSTMAAIVGFIREFQAAADNPYANDVTLVLKGYLQAISAPSPVVEMINRSTVRSPGWYDDWDDDFGL